MLNFSSQKLYSGDAWAWTESLTGKSPSDYTLKTIIKQLTSQPLTFTAAAEGEKFSFTVSSQTTNIPSGEYSYQIKLIEKLTGNTLTLEEGVIVILANLLVNQDPREYWKVIADNLKEIYRKLSVRETDMAEYGGRKFTYKNMTELLSLIDDAEQRAGISEPVPVIREVY